MKNLINFMFTNKKTLICVLTIAIFLIITIVGVSSLKSNESITDPTASPQTTNEELNPTATIPPIVPETTEPENTTEISGSSGLEVTIQGGTTEPANSGSQTTTSKASANTTTKAAVPTATAAKPKTSVSIVTNSKKPTATATNTPSSNYPVDSSEYAVAAINAAVECCKINDTVDYRTIDNGYREKLLYYTPCSVGNDINVDNWIKVVKNNTIVSESYFVPDSTTSAKNNNGKYIISGSYYIKFGSQTKASYLKNEGVTANKWYVKRADVVMSFYGSQGLWEHGTYTCGNIAWLDAWKEAK